MFNGGFNGGFKGGFGGGANLGMLMKQAQKMQEDMQKAKAEIEETEYHGKAGGGMVEVVLSGAKKVLSVKIKPEVCEPDEVEIVEDMVSAAFNDALAQIEKDEKEKLPQMPAGL